MRYIGPKEAKGERENWDTNVMGVFIAKPVEDDLCQIGNAPADEEEDGHIEDND